MAIDLHPAADALAGILRTVPDDALGRPTPCPEYSVARLLDHVHGFCLAFTAGARKDPPPGPPPEDEVGPHPRLGAWRDELPRHLQALADAWAEPGAWDGDTNVAGVDLPAEVAGLFALDELLVHGWDLAVATEQELDVPPDLLDALHGFVVELTADGAPRDGLFGPPVALPPDAPLLHRVLGLTGRDPGWRP
jgi:uncharacterized protein (TIGR03086 family)